jgi:hypothetical protein
MELAGVADRYPGLDQQHFRLHFSVPTKRVA